MSFKRQQSCNFEICFIVGWFVSYRTHTSIWVNCFECILNSVAWRAEWMSWRRENEKDERMFSLGNLSYLIWLFDSGSAPRINYCSVVSIRFFFPSLFSNCGIQYAVRNYCFWLEIWNWLFCSCSCQS